MVRPSESKVRSRKPKKDENGKQEKSSSKENVSVSKKQPSSSLLVVLFVMVAITWGIAATSYFGIIDYKGLIGWKSDSDLKSAEIRSKEGVPTSNNKPTNENLKKDASPQQDVDKTKDKVKKTSNKDSSKKKKQKKKGEDNFTSKNDRSILKELAEGEKLIGKQRGIEAVNHFKNLVKSHPNSPRARFGLAESLNLFSQQQKSNSLLQECIAAYEEVTTAEGCPPELRKKSLLTKSDRQTFLGQMKGALMTLTKLTKEFPQDINILNKLGVAYLMFGKNDKAKVIYQEVLKIKPDDGFALTHFGFIVKADGDWIRGAEYLKRGTDSNEEGTQSGKFYFHLGDALYRTNRTKEAEEVYEKAAKLGLFKSKYQRSLYNVDRLKSRPFWTPKQAGAVEYVKKLEQNWKMIRDEALRLMDVEKGLFLKEEESLKDTGDWRQFTLFARGQKTPECSRVPKTCALVEKMTNAKGCTRGQIKYSVMMPGTHVWPHTGPTNCRLRMHLGLVVPTTGDGARLRCADQYKTWEEGKVMIFDDSFEHEVWQNAESFRLILIVDVWHPDVTEHEKKTLSAI